MWGRGWEGAMVLAPLSAGPQSLRLLPTIKLGPSGAVSWVGELVHTLGPCGSLQWSLLWGWEFLLPPPPPRMFSISGLRLHFPELEPWVVQPALLPDCSSQCVHARMWGCRVCQPPPCGVHQLQPGLPCSTIRHLTGFASPRLAASPLLPGCSSLPLPPVWMNVSSLSPWLSDFHIVWFSVSSGCFLFLNCCCPSFGCARRHSVSTYSSILARSPRTWDFDNDCVKPIVWAYCYFSNIRFSSPWAWDDAPLS